MTVVAHEPSGFEGVVISVDVDIRRGIPSIDLVGLADGAIREARERVRAAVRNSGFQFPLDHILVSLSPAGLRKEGSAYDLPIALAVLGAAGILPDPGEPLLAIGELRLDGEVRPVHAVLPAIAAGLGAGIRRFLVPVENRSEASALRQGTIYPIARLSEAVEILSAIRDGTLPSSCCEPENEVITNDSYEGDFSDIKGLTRVRRALEIGAAGGHHMLLFGPPGSGKTLAARRFATILPDLTPLESIEATTIHSLAGIPLPRGGLIRRPPFRSPHHSASLEGLVGGGKTLRPGEISLSHRGVLFLDEVPEFHRDALQALREPIEEGRVSLARAGKLSRFPADFTLLAAANPCPCGNLGRRDRVCVCSPPEIGRYWRKIGGPLLDRIDIRIPVRPEDARTLRGPLGESSETVRGRVMSALLKQRKRYSGYGFVSNAKLPAALVEKYCSLDDRASACFPHAIASLGLSSRACHSILKTARTIADLEGMDDIGENELLEAIQHRRYADSDYFWNDL